VFCGKCGTNLPEDSQFCSKCGQTVSAAANIPAPAASIDFCRRCGVRLPAFSQFCLKCGQKVTIDDPASGAVAAPAVAPSTCRKCAAVLPDGSQFCLKCGQAVGVPAADATASATASSAAIEALRLRRQRSKPRIAIWFLVPALLATIWWAATSSSPGAQQFQRLFNRSHTEAIVPATFVVKSRSFSYYKFMVPRGASSVVVSGPFSATGGSNDNDIEVSLLTDTNFVDWQDGYVTSTYYSSGKAAQGDINASLPPAAGTYYLVFSNRLSQRTAKTVQATVTLHYNRGWSSP